MPAPQPQPARSRAIGTINPVVFSAVVSVDPALIVPSDIKNGMLYRNTPQYFDKTIIPKGYGDYIYTYNENGDGVVNFHFGLDTSKNPDGSPATMKPFRSTWRKFGDHRWCPLLKGLAFLEDDDFPQSTNIIQGNASGLATAPRNYVRELYIAEVNEGSRFLLDEFFSSVPFVIGRYPVPQPGRVSYQINGLQGAFEDCLHDDIEIPNTSSATATIVGDTQGTGDSKIPGQFFPRTNFRRRRPYVLSCDQDMRDGGWYFQRLRVFPPRQPKLTTE